MKLNDNILSLKGVGEKTSVLLNKMNIVVNQDLLQYYPREYITYEQVIPFEKIVVGEACALYVRLIGTGLTAKKVRNLTILNGNVSDMSKNILGATQFTVDYATRKQIQITFFNMPYLKKTLFAGRQFIVYGKVQRKGIDLVMEQPQIFTPEEYEKLMSSMQPVYSLTKGITNHTIQKLVSQILNQVDEIGIEYLPIQVVESEALIPYKKALYGIHFPENGTEMIEARKRLAFDEFFLFILGIKKMKDYNKGNPFENPLEKVEDTDQFISNLPYRLTDAQQKVWKELEDDLSKDVIMNRLIQGDVGSGKTILAFLSLLFAAANNRQGSLMAPTEVLARQHYDNMVEMVEQYQLCIRPVLLVGSMTAKQKKDAYQLIESGQANVIIGTHALIQEKVIYHNLSLVITDEQHRFGVRQRETLAKKGIMVHVLVMSATPIPRTLAIILYGDLHISVLDEMPVGRIPIKNCVVNTSYRKKAYDFIEKEVSKGRQAYVICPMVMEGEMEDLENVIDYTEKLKNHFSANIKVAYLHGKMKPIEKTKIMEAFALKNIDVLVSTTVIEVGINVPNATVMMIENAERFGLAQLHQLRGRVGRGKEQSYCMFISSSDNQRIMDRLSVLNKSNDGFFIANEDLKSRGPGDLFGIRQSGELQFKVADVFQDSNLLILASKWVNKILEEDPSLELEKNKGIQQKFYKVQNEEAKIDLHIL